MRATWVPIQGHGLPIASAHSRSHIFIPDLIGDPWIPYIRTYIRITCDILSAETIGSNFSKNKKGLSIKKKTTPVLSRVVVCFFRSFYLSVQQIPPRFLEAIIIPIIIEVYCCIDLISLYYKLLNFRQEIIYFELRNWWIVIQGRSRGIYVFLIAT